MFGLNENLIACEDEIDQLRKQINRIKSSNNNYEGVRNGDGGGIRKYDNYSIGPVR